MKQFVLFILFVCLFLTNAFAQSTTTTNLQDPVLQNRYLGYSNNYALLFRTNNINRIKINHNISYSINGLAGNRNGFMLLSNNPTATSLGIGNSPMATNNVGAFSLLHLIGDDSPFVQEGEKIC